MRYFFAIIRWPNLLIMALTQSLFFYMIVAKLVAQAHTFQPYLWMLVFATVCIAAAGNIINDYFDVYIDRINKGDKLIVDKHISRRTAIKLHLILSVIGLLVSAYISFALSKWLILFSNAAIVILLWLYAALFKKTTLLGNVIISLMIAWVIIAVSVMCSPSFFFFSTPESINSQHILLFKLTLFYAGFAFAINLIRELVKDIEDMEGDRKFGAKTLPIQFGIQATKLFTQTWLLLCLAFLIIVSWYAWKLNLQVLTIYNLLLVIIPLLWIGFKLNKATTKKDFSQLSIAIKLVMVTGICSTLFVSQVL